MRKARRWLASGFPPPLAAPVVAGAAATGSVYGGAVVITASVSTSATTAASFTVLGATAIGTVAASNAYDEGKRGEELSAEGLGGGLESAGVTAIVAAPAVLKEQRDAKTAELEAQARQEVIQKIDFTKVQKQLDKRGWTEGSVKEVIAKPEGSMSVVDERWLKGAEGPLHEKATAYFVPGTNGQHYVVVNNQTGLVVQVTNLNDPGWIPTLKPWTGD